MKMKRSISMLLVLSMLLSLCVTTAYAATTTTDYTAGLTVTKETNEKLSVSCDVGPSGSSSVTIKGVQTFIIAYDLKVLKPLLKSGNEIDVSDLTTSPVIKAMADGVYSDPATAMEWNTKVYAYKSSDGNTGYLLIQPAEGDVGSTLTSSVSLAKVYFGFQTGKGYGDVTKQTVRFTTNSEQTGQSENKAIRIVNDDVYYEWSNGGTDDTLTITPTITASGFSFNLPALPTGSTGAQLSYYFANTSSATSGDENARYNRWLHVKVSNLPDECGKVTLKFVALGDTESDNILLYTRQTTSVTDNSWADSIQMSNYNSIGKPIKITFTCENYSGELTATTAAVQKAAATGTLVAPTLTATERAITVTNAKTTQQYAVTEATATSAPTGLFDWSTPSSDGSCEFTSYTGSTSGYLGADTTYKVWTRLKGDDTHEPGTATYAEITTAPQPISRLNLTVPQLKAGTTAANLPTKDNVTIGEQGTGKYTVDSIEWLNADGTAAAVTGDGKIQGTTSYQVKIVLKTTERYTFAASPSVQDNSHSYTVSVSEDKKTATVTTTVASTARSIAGFRLAIATSSGEATSATYDVPRKGGSKTATIKCYTVYNDGTEAQVNNTDPTWSVVDAADHPGVTVDEGVVTILPNAAAGNVTIQAKRTGFTPETQTVTITLTKNTPELKTMTINGAATIAVPKATETSPKTESYTVTGEDQYGATMEVSGVTWSVSSATGVSIDSSTGKLSVTNAAQSGDVTVTATYGSGETTKTATKAVTITRETSAPSTVTIGGGEGALSVPEMETWGTDGTYTMVTAFTATVQDQYGVVMPEQSVTWSVEGGDSSVTIDQNGKLSLTSKTLGGGVYVKASVNDTVRTTKYVPINRSGATTAKFVVIKKDFVEVTADTIVIPSGTTPNTADYTAYSYNKYGSFLSNSASWSLSSTPDGVTLNGSTVSVASNASATAEGSPLVLTAKAGTDDSAPTATVSISLINKQPAHIALARSSGSVTYGSNITMTASAYTNSSHTGDALTGGTWSWAYDSTVFEPVGATNSASITLKTKKAADLSSVGATYEDGTYRGTNSTGIAVAKKELSITGLTATDRAYNAGTSVALTGGTLTGIVGEDDVSVTMPTTGTVADANVGTGKAVTVTKPGLTGDDADNYTLKDITGIIVTISKADPSYTLPTGLTATYGQTLANVTLGTSWSWMDPTTSVGDASETAKTFYAKFTPTDTDNYNVMENIDVSVKVNKAYRSGVTLGSVTPYTARYGTTGTVDLRDHIVPGGTASYSSIVSTTSDIFDGTPIVTNNVLSYTFVDDADKVGKSGQINVKVTSTNYTDYNIAVFVQVVDKLSPNLSADPVTATYGETGKSVSATRNGTGAISYAVKSGSEEYITVNSTTGALTFKKAGEAWVTVSVAATDDYAAASTDVKITIGKATVTVTAKDQSIQVGAEAPDLTSPVAGTHYTVSGLVGSDTLTALAMKYQKDGDDATPDTSAAGSYDIVVTAAADAEKYTVNTEDGKLTIANRPAPPAAGGKHRVTVADTENGSVTVDPTGAKEGETITVTATPDAGYAVEDVTVTDRSGNKVKFRMKGGKYVFEMPNTGVTVKVSFARSENPFVDVPEGKYFYDAVMWAVDNGITGGTDATHFSPYASCTRGQLVTFLWRAAGEPKAKNANDFSDVEKGRYCEDAVAWAAENEIVGGYDDGTFRPDATITRQQTAAILWRFAKYAGMDVSVGEDTNILSFNDALTISDYAFPAIQWAVGAGVMGGNDGDLQPRGVCNRAQIVTMLYRSIAK